MADVYFDRMGREKYPDDIIPLNKKAYYAILVKDKKVLITYPPHIKVPEFPGGGMSRNDDFRSCLYKKLYEDSGLEYMLDRGNLDYQQVVKYFDDDVRPYGQFCIYDQTFMVYDADSYGFDTSREMWKTPSNGLAVWVDIDDIFKGVTKINYMHWQAFQKLFL